MLHQLYRLTFKSSMYRSRQKRLPPLPKTRAEIDLTGDWVNTLSGVQMPYSICFVILRQYMLMEHSRSAPACSRNFSPSMDFSMTGGFLWYMPCYHPRPEQITTGCLHTSRKSYRIDGLQMSPQSVMADFELAVIQSLEMQLPGVEIQGCYFHFSQCLWRKGRLSG